MKSLILLIIGGCLIFSCSKTNIDPEQELCKEATSIPKITFLKLSNNYVIEHNILGSNIKKDSIAITFKYQDAEADIGLNGTNKNSDGSQESLYVEVYKKNTDGTFQKIIFDNSETLNYRIPQVPNKAGYNFVTYSATPKIMTLSTCSGEITYCFVFDLLFSLGLKLNDIIKFRMYIKDQASHTSNIIESSETSLSENP